MKILLLHKIKGKAFNFNSFDTFWSCVDSYNFLSFSYFPLFITWDCETDVILSYPSNISTIEWKEHLNLLSLLTVRNSIASPYREAFIRKRKRNFQWGKIFPRNSKTIAKISTNPKKEPKFQKDLKKKPKSLKFRFFFLRIYRNFGDFFGIFRNIGSFSDFYELFFFGFWGILAIFFGLLGALAQSLEF